MLYVTGLSPESLRGFLVRADGAALTLDVLIQNSLDKRIIRRVVTATGDALYLPLVTIRIQRAIDMPPGIQDFVDFARVISQTCQYLEFVLSDLHNSFLFHHPPSWRPVRRVMILNRSILNTASRLCCSEPDDGTSIAQSLVKLTSEGPCDERALSSLL